MVTISNVIIALIIFEGIKVITAVLFKRWLSDDLKEMVEEEKGRRKTFSERLDDKLREGEEND